MEGHHLFFDPSELPMPTAAVSSATVGGIMTTDVVTVGPYDRLYLVQHLLDQHRIHHLLVEDEGQLLGVISDRDLRSAVSPFLDTQNEDDRDTRTMHLRAREIMSADPICATPVMTIEQAAKLLLQHNISCLPVAGPNQSIAGIVTWKDILRYYVRAATLPKGIS